MSNKRGEQTRELVYNAIINYINEYKYPPTVREVCQMVGLKSTASVHRHIEVLKEQGLLESDLGKQNPRALRVPNITSKIDEVFLAKCKEVNRLQEQVQRLQRELDICKMKMKKYKSQ